MFDVSREAYVYHLLSVICHMSLATSVVGNVDSSTPSSIVVTKEVSFCVIIILFPSGIELRTKI